MASERGGMEWKMHLSLDVDMNVDVVVGMEMDMYEGMNKDIPTGGFNKCEFSSNHLGKLIGGGNILTLYLTWIELVCIYVDAKK
jgi:hypothetical protein